MLFNSLFVGELYGDNNEQRGGEDIQSGREKVGLVNLNALFMFGMEMTTIGLAVITFAGYKFCSGKEYKYDISYPISSFHKRDFTVLKFFQSWV